MNAPFTQWSEILSLAREGRLADVHARVPLLQHLKADPELLEAAVAICADSDSVGIETWRLEILVRLILRLALEQNSENSPR